MRSLIKNIERLAEVLALTNCEQDILAYAICANSEEVLTEILQNIGEVSIVYMSQVLSRILGYKVPLIQQSLQKNGALVSSGLLKVTSYKDCISDRLELLDGLDEILFQKNLGPNDILDNFFTKSKQAELSLVDFPHMKPDVEILRPFLKGAIKKKEKGVNILIYGIPGAGKTELVRSLAKNLEMDLFEINVENSDEAPLSGQARFCAYQLCQKLLSKKPSLILFDEIEDIFPDQVFSLLLAKRETNKGWTNRALETNPNPAFWLCNSIDQIDKSYLRRFDYAFEMRIPPASVREKIIENR